MPAALDLTGKRFGRLTVIRLLKEPNKHGQRVWLCQCDCGRKTRVATSSLTSGNTQSCGCRRDEWRRRSARSLTKASREKWKAEEDIVHNGKIFLAPRKAMRFLGVSDTLLDTWKISCTYLDGEGIEPVDHAIGRRPVTYFAEDDIDRIRKARAKRTPVPGFPGLVYIPDAARDLGIDVSALYYRLRKAKMKPIQKSGKARDGRAHPRGYITQAQFDTLCKPPVVDPDAISFHEAAEILGVCKRTVQEHVSAGALHSKKRPMKDKSGAWRKRPSLSRAEVQRLHAQRSGAATPAASEGPDPKPAAQAKTAAEPAAQTATAEPATSNRRAGRPTGSFSMETARRKREMLDEWDRGTYEENKTAAGRAHGFHRSDATKIINEHERQKCRK